MHIINLTPHAIVLRDDTGEETAIPPSGTVARCLETAYKVGVLELASGSELSRQVPIKCPTYGRVIDLPDPVEGTIYVVSFLAAYGAGRYRPDVFFPGEVGRDVSGRPTHCTSLYSFSMTEEVSQG